MLRLLDLIYRALTAAGVSEAAVATAFEVIDAEADVVIVNGTATTTLALLTANAGATSTTRILEITNLSSTETLGVLLKNVGYNYTTNPSALTIANARKIPPGCTWTRAIAGSITLGVIATGSTAYSAIVQDVVA